MNIPNTMMMNATTRFGSIRSEAACGGIMVGDAVVAFAMVCSVQSREGGALPLPVLTGRGLG